MLVTACAMNAANHDPIWTMTLAGNYKDIAACAFDRLHRDNSLANTAVNEARSTTRIWAASGPSTIMELVFEQTGTNQVRVEYRNTYWIDVSDEKDSALSAVKECKR
jgi:hypothetical protein